MCIFVFLPSSHLWPVYFWWHLQVSWPASSIKHVPPFRHTYEWSVSEHLSIGWKIVKYVKLFLLNFTFLILSIFKQITDFTMLSIIFLGTRATRHSFVIYFACTPIFTDVIAIRRAFTFKLLKWNHLLVCFTHYN